MKTTFEAARGNIKFIECRGRVIPVNTSQEVIRPRKHKKHFFTVAWGASEATVPKTG